MNLYYLHTNLSNKLLQLSCSTDYFKNCTIVFKQKYTYERGNNVDKSCKAVDTDLSKSLLRVEDFYEERNFIVHNLETVSRLRQQLLYRLRRGERRRRARRRCGSSRAGTSAAGVTIMKMSTTEEDWITVRRNAARKRSKGESVKRRARSWCGCAKQSLS